MTYRLAIYDMDRTVTRRATYTPFLIHCALRRAPWRHKLSYLLREPGWTHDGSRETSSMIRARWQARQVARKSVAGENPIAEPREAA